MAAQDRGEGIFCIVDLHATTVAYDPTDLRERLYDTAAILLAAGLDPERCIFFRQSDVHEHAELAWLLSSLTAYGDLGRMHQFKEKAGAQRELVSVGLFTYPVLMAADVLAYRAQEVPVGDDQRQHIELMRDIAERFNARFAGVDGEPVLVVPEGVYREVGARIMDLQAPERKMSTTGGSEQGTVYVLDEPSVIERKIKSAVTDSGSEVARAPDKPGVSNLIEILAAARSVGPDGGRSRAGRRPLRGSEGDGRRGRRRVPAAGAGALRGAARRRAGARGDPRGRGRARARDRLRDARRRARADGPRGSPSGAPARVSR